MAKDLPFIISTDISQVNPETRKRIRRHVMIGKNRDRLITRAPKTKAKAAPRIPKPTKRVRPGDIASSCIPGRVGCEQSLLRFAGGVDASTASVVFHFSSIVKRTLFPLEPYLSFSGDKTRYIEPLAYDELYLHTMIFTTTTYFELLQGRSHAVSPHFNKSLRLLRQRLENADKVTSALTIYVVFTLGMHAFIMGDMHAVRSHMDGVRRIIDLRAGGVHGLRERHSKLLVELLRFDIGLALHGGSKPYFDAELQTQPAEDGPLQETCETKVLAGLDIRVQTAWKSLKHFCAQIGTAALTRKRITKDAMLQVMTTVMYDLIDVSYPADSINEAVRLGILVFSAGCFLPWRAFKLSCTHLEGEYRHCLSHLHAPPDLAAWLLMTGLVTLDSVDRHLQRLLLQNANQLGIRSWPEMKTVLESFLWIGAVGDSRGEEIFSHSIRAQHKSLEPPAGILTMKK